MKANPKLIGAFVLGAIALAIVAVGVFGGGRFFQPSRTAVAYFDGSLAGLSVGAPVSFRGVRIGTVSDIKLRLSPEDMTPRIPVYIEFEPDRTDWVGAGAPDKAEIQALIDRGLRGQLVMQSFVTGQLAIQLDFRPEVPARYRHPGEDVMELPTAPSDIEALRSAIQELDLQGLAASAGTVLTKLNALLDREATQSLMPELLKAVQSFDALAATLREEVQPLAQGLQQTDQAAQATLAQATTSIQAVERDIARTVDSFARLADSLNAEVTPLSRQLRATLGNADAALRQAEATLRSAQATLNPDSAVQRDLGRALKEISSAARATRALAEELERNPSALLRGKR